MGPLTPIKPAVRSLRSAWRALRPSLGFAAHHEPTTEVPPRPAAQRPPRREVKIRVEETPNPHARKLTCSVTLHEGPSLVVSTAADAANNPVARALFAVPGVTGLFLVRDFVTVTRSPAAPWPDLLPRLISVLSDALAEG